VSPNQYLTDMRAEVAALRAVVARVEGLCQAWEATAQPRAYALRWALGSTDSDPAATERQGEAEGAGDGV